MKVLLIAADVGGSAKYRLKEPARVVTEQFPEIEVRVDTGADVEAEMDVKTKLVTVKEVKEDVDVIVLQRPLKQQLHAILEQARRQGIAVVVEMDDDLTTVHPANSFYAQVQPQLKPLSNREWFEKSARAADLVTCTTPELTKFNTSHSILPNYVAESIFEVKRQTPLTVNPVVGWSGTLQTHPYDLDVTRGQVGKMLTEADGDFFVVGDGAGVQRALKLSPSTPFRASGWVGLDAYYQALVDNIDIGIVPLEHSTFNSAKSWLKGLEFAALGIPFVASATNAYGRLASYGVGRIAADSNGFRYALRNWLRNPAKAQEDGRRYRDEVRDGLTYEQHAADWVHAWERAIDARKKAQK